ncbi:ATP-binding protein [Candidatus Methylopumilus universalis]|uniref:ATP-binding protein n=1 Tax=Candidatus Methylopumilus universalis TaxID=2588536 RepID=UPI00167CA6B0|nr:RNA-binding domain-containing protein [Candidatus Methylopumilus universalis]
MNEENRHLIETFLSNLIKKKSLNKVLLISHSFFNSFGSLKSIPHDEISGKEMKFPSQGKWDLVLGDFPMGLTAQTEELKNIYGIKHNFAAIYKSMEYVNDNGYGIFLVEQPAMLTKVRYQNIRMLGIRDLTQAIITPPPNYLLPHTSISPIFLILGNSKIDKEFVASLEEIGDSEGIVENFTNQKSSNSLNQGVWLEKGEFKGLAQWKISQQIKSLDTAYNKFHKMKVTEIASSINSCKVGDSFEDLKNSVYIPLIGNQSVVADISDTKIKHQNYIQVVCNEKIIDPYYLAAFFNSALGKLIRESHCAKGSVIPRMSKSDLSDTEIAIPDLATQKEIVDSIRKLKVIRNKTLSFENNLSINPVNKTVLNKIEQILEAIDELDDADKIKSIIREGESKTIEFKQTFNLDVKSQKESANNFLVTASIKTIAAFLNTDGGTLLIGVADNGEVTGIDEEIERLNGNIPDKFLLHFKNFIHHRIGAEFYPYIDQKIVEVDEKKVLFVTCKQSEKEVFVDGKDFYVRSNPSTDKLEGSKLLDYIKNHFKLKGS